MIAYKLFRMKQGRLYPLFINRSTETKQGIWLESECIPTNGFKVRQGWHCCFEMNAPHLKKDLKSGEHRVWVKCQVEGVTTYDRPLSQGGRWILADRIMVLEVIG